MDKIIVIGLGIVGSAVSYLCSEKNTIIHNFEKDLDICEETSGANSAIIHSGYDPKPGTLKAKLNVRGNYLYDDLCKKLDVEFNRIGSLTLARSYDEMVELQKLENRARVNGVYVEILNQEQVRKMEPNVSSDVIGALYAPTCGIVNPFELCYAATEVAIANGASLHLGEEVIAIQEENEGYRVTTTKSSYYADVVINCAGVNADKIHNMLFDDKETILPRKGEYHILDHFDDDYVNHVLFSVPTEKGKGAVVAPTTSGNYIIGPSSEFVESKEDVSVSKEVLDEIEANVLKLVKTLPKEHIVHQFAGLRAVHTSDDFVIRRTKGFIDVLGIQSPGLAAAPAIAEMVLELVKEIIPLEEKKDAILTRKRPPKLSKLSNEERNELVKQNPNYGKIICRCEQISLGEIEDALASKIPPKTIKAVKKHTRAGFGTCQGGFCEPLILEILAKHQNIAKEDVLYKNEHSYIVKKDEGSGEEL